MTARARRKRGSKPAASAVPDHSNLPRSRLLYVAQWLLRLPRILRILIVSIFSLCATVSVSPVVDVLYLNLLYDESTRILPSLFSVSVGLVMYVVGWVVLVGGLDQVPAARLRVLWYVGIGVLAVSMTIFWLVFGSVIGNAPL